MCALRHVGRATICRQWGGVGRHGWAGVVHAPQIAMYSMAHTAFLTTHGSFGCASIASTNAGTTRHRSTRPRNRVPASLPAHQQQQQHVCA